MGKKRKNEGRKFLRHAIAMLILLFGVLLLKKDNLINWLQASFTINKQRTEIQQLTRENEALNNKVKNLSENIDSLETFARENYFFTTKDDDVFIIE